MMGMNSNELLLKEEVFQIVGAAIEVLNGLGHGLHEKPYENARVVEFGIREIPFLQQQRFDVRVRDRNGNQRFPAGIIGHKRT
jgi:GxxExxY protein